MSGVRPLAVSSDLVYEYDGSFQGFLCCVFESVYSRKIPFDIFKGEAPPTLFDIKYIDTEKEKAQRVYDSMSQKISKEVSSLISTVFLSCLEQKELKMLKFLLRAYREGNKLLYKLGDPDTAPLLAAEKNFFYEAHLLKGFIRFCDVGGSLVAVITPKNYILPAIAKHFILRYTDEDFMIFDKTHHCALVYREGKYEILQIEKLEIPDMPEKEVQYQVLWKRFYDTVAIESRENPRCRMTHMPKRFWENMTEVKELL